jgi:hypothetical protein
VRRRSSGGQRVGPASSRRRVVRRDPKASATAAQRPPAWSSRRRRRDGVGVHQPQVDPRVGRGGDHLGGAAGHAGLHGVEEPVVDDVHSPGAQPAGQGLRAAVHAGGDRGQPLRAVVDGVGAGHDGEQHLRGADVAGRLLPADVLLAGLQRQR